jgi:hypothetical protein
MKFSVFLFSLGQFARPFLGFMNPRSGQDAWINPSSCLINPIILSPGPALLHSVLSFVLAPLFLLHSKQEIFHSPNRCVFSLKERDDREQKVHRKDTLYFYTCWPNM